MSGAMTTKEMSWFQYLVAAVVLVGIFGCAWLVGGFPACVMAILLFGIQVEQAQKIQRLQEDLVVLREFVGIDGILVPFQPSVRGTGLGQEAPPGGGPDAEAS